MFAEYLPILAGGVAFFFVVFALVALWLSLEWRRKG